MKERTATDGDARAHFPTEIPLAAAMELDRLSTADAFDVMNAEDARVAHAVALAKPAIVRAIDLVAARLARGGRLFYVGAGTSGRLGVLDASECPPTFQSPPRMVQGWIAGGTGALTRSVEGAEDARDGSHAAFVEHAVGADDVVFGIAAGGTTPYVHGAIDRARELGAATMFLACVPFESAPDSADVSIRVVTGPEVLAGSTRLKAATATKLVLNAVSTLAMVKLGKVHGPWMVDLDTRGNRKLWQRGTRIVSRLTGFDRDRAEHLLGAAEGQVKLAVVMGVRSLSLADARARLTAARGYLRRALEE